MGILSTYLMWGEIHTEYAQTPLFTLNKVDMKIATDATPALA